MNPFKSIIAGFAGAAALSALNESLKKADPEAPRLDLIGEEAMVKSAEALSLPVPKGNTLYNAALAGDIMSNAAYYASIGMGSKKNVFLRSIGVGLTAGMAAIKLPEPLGLNEEPVAATDKRKMMTVGYYVLGAMVTAIALKMMASK